MGYTIQYILINMQTVCVLFISLWFGISQCYQYIYKDYFNYCQTSNIRCTLEGSNIVYDSDVVGASPVGAAPTTSSFST